jgi:peptidoglycan/xylan/chitin deacetylase (PgdA/CDA1 family)
MGSLRQLGIRLTDILARLAAPVATRLNGGDAQIPVLCYHRVLPQFAEGAVPAYSIRPEQFEAQMKYLSSHAYQSLSINQYEAIAAGRVAAPHRAVLVTFDDGFADNLLVALEIAKRHSITLNFFVCTGFIDGIAKPIDVSADEAIRSHRESHPKLWNPLTWEEIRFLRDAGCGLGFHSHLHRDFSELDESEIKQDIDRGLARFREQVGFTPVGFAFPQGTELSCPGTACDLLRRNDIPLLFSTKLARSTVPLKGLVSPRILIYEQDDLAIFVLKLKGAYDWLGTARAFYQKRRMSRAHAALRTSVPPPISQ